MRRIVAFVILSSTSCLLISATPSTTWAHGGVYQGPGGGVPPHLRDPSDPTPPPPPPPSGPATPPDTSAPPGTPAPTGPVTPPTPPAPTPPVTQPDGPLGGGTRRTASIGFDDWTFWWAYESPAILHVKEAIYRLNVSLGSGIETMKGDGGKTDTHRLTEVSVRDVMIPALLRVIDPARREHPDVRSAAYIALARVTADPAHIAILLRGARGEGAEDSIVRESAALALGLLRRGDLTRRFDAKELDRVRDEAFAIVEDKESPTRTRAFAALAIGLLGDQPTGKGADPTGEASAPGKTAPTPSETGAKGTRGGTSARGGQGASSALSLRSVAERIFDDLGASYADADVPACLVLALSQQPATTVSLEMTDELKEATLKSRLRGRTVDPITSAYAALALGRVGGTEHRKTLSLALEARTVPQVVKRSAAVGLGQLAARLEGDERRDVAATLVRAIDASKEPSTRAFAVMSLARLLAGEAERGQTDAWTSKAHPDRVLLDLAARGRGLRTYGALALGFVARSIGTRPDVLEHAEFRQTALASLRDGLGDLAMDPRARGAFAVGLGLAQDAASGRALLGLLSDKSLDKELRSYAALALGMIGEATKEQIAAIASAMREGASDELSLQSATALGLLGARDAVKLLLSELSEADTAAVTAQIVSALGRIGDDRAVRPLAALALDDVKPDVTRALAVVGLGLVGDLEPHTTFSRISSSFNYRACTPAVREFLSIL